MRRFSILCALSLALATLALSVTLEKLSLEEMISASTTIVRGTVGEAVSVDVNGAISTDYRIEVKEVLEGEAGSRNLVVRLPGGTHGNRTQSFAGVPRLASGSEFVFFLWRSRQGTLHVVGMTQGMLRVSGQGTSRVASRGVIDGILLDRRSGMVVKDEPVRIRLQELRATVSRLTRARQGATR